MLHAEKAEVQTVPGCASIAPAAEANTIKLQCKAARRGSGWWFAEPQKLIGDVCHAMRAWRARDDLQRTDM